MYTRPYRQVFYNRVEQKSLELVDHDFSDKTPFDECPPWFRHNSNEVVNN